MTYHNTLPVAGAELEKRKELTSKQDIAVLEALKEVRTWMIYFAPEDILRHLQRNSDEKDKWIRTPLTSVRRSFNSLIGRGFLSYVRDENGKIVTALGGYGHKVRLVQLNP